MRSVPFVLVLVLVLVLGPGCSTAPKRSAVHYSAPSFVPVREKLTSDQGFIAHAITVAGEAKAAIARAETIQAELSAAPADNAAPCPDRSGAAADLKEALGEADGKIDDLTTQLGSTRDGLAESQTLITTLEGKVETQTNGLNTCGDEKNQAIDERNALASKAKHDARKYHRLKFAVCSLAAALACFIAVRLGLLKLLSFLGPYGMIGIAAIPAIVFGALWFIL